MIFNLGGFHAASVSDQAIDTHLIPIYWLSHFIINHIHKEAAWHHLSPLWSCPVSVHSFLAPNITSPCQDWRENMVATLQFYQKNNPRSLRMEKKHDLRKTETSVICPNFKRNKGVEHGNCCRNNFPIPTCDEER